MELVADEMTVASTASPSPVPPPRERPDSSKQYFRLKSMSTLTAPVDEGKLKSLARTRTVRLRPAAASPPVAHRRHTAGSSATAWSRVGGGEGGTIEEEGKFPIPDNPTAWARYGFLDEDLLLRATGQSAEEGSSGGEAGEEKAMDEGSSRSMARARTDPGDGWRATQATTPSAADGGERRHHPAASGAAGEDERSRRRGGEGGEGDVSPDVGTSTPPTDIVSPSSEERQQQQRNSQDGGGAGKGGGLATAAAAAAAANNKNAGPSAAATTARRRPGGGALDSMAASMLASSQAAAARAEEETKEQELLALRQHEARQATMDMAQQQQQQQHHRNTGGINRTTPQAIAEIERHKRNRAERLRAYGCQR